MDGLVVNVLSNAHQLKESFSPEVLAQLNGQDVRIAKLEGEFIWHLHEDQDEMFLVVDGELDIHFRDKVLSLKQWDSVVVPRGVEHKPVAKDIALVLLFEPSETINTGNVINELTKG